MGAANTLRRRTLLGAVGAATVGTIAGTVAGNDGDDDGDYPPTAGGRYTDGRVCTYPCGTGKPVGCRDDGVCDWAPSSITFQNCSDCPREVYFAASGKVSLERYMPLEETEFLDSEIGLEIRGGQRVTVFFTGSVTHLANEHCDLNVAISQRSAGYTGSDPCTRHTEPETESAPPARVEKKRRARPIEHRHEHIHEHYHEHDVRVTVEDERDETREHDPDHDYAADDDYEVTHPHRTNYYRDDGTFDRETCFEEAETYAEYDSCRDHCVPDC
ncbi:hypothetical protein [Natrononativus amylolyticus]|uniref:hypothetical protein n=1 Tax=Natrononativus amylolyticus TaxID=2963434 RepID=UPI0020CCC756|nr:hypothetical protein [Natrononativus amylolyticus]